MSIRNNGSYYIRQKLPAFVGGAARSRSKDGINGRQCCRGGTMAVRIMSILMAALMIASAAAAAAPDAAVNAASADGSAKASGSSTAGIATAKRATIKGYDITFKKKIRTDALLGSGYKTNSLKTKGYKKKIKLSWKAVKNARDVSGYIIVRQDIGGGRWREISAVGRNARSFTDKTAKAKNTEYKYTIVPFRKKGSIREIAQPAAWASALTTKSAYDNMYSIEISRPARTAAVSIGDSATFIYNYPSDDIYDKTMRWSSSDKSIATVSKDGTITGKGHGTATLTGRMHTGRTIKTTVTVVEPGTTQGMIEVMQSWLGYSFWNAKHKGIVDIYNSVLPHPRGYAVTYSDSWCAAALSAAAIKSRNEQATGRECAVDPFIKMFKSAGRWQEDGSVVPKPGDFIVYGWKISLTATVKSNNTSASHIGIVESVDEQKKTITVIEGNMGVGYQGRRTIPVGWRYIRGYGRPAYSDATL